MPREGDWIAPELAEAYYNLGLVHQAQGNLKEAVKCYRRAIEIDQDHHQAHFNLGCAFTNLRSRTRPLSAFAKPLRLPPIIRKPTPA